jgi:lipopolysaccharide export system permease protein
VKKLDLYLARTYLSNYAGALSVFIVIAIIFDLTEKLDGFLKHSLSAVQVFTEYYLHFIPYYANLLSPLFVFIAIIFTGSRMAERNEIIAILNTGWSFRRLCIPFVGVALLIGSLNYFLSNWVLPSSNRARIRFESLYLRDPSYNHTRNQQFQISPGRMVFLESYSNVDSTGYRLALDRFRNRRLVTRLSAERIRWNSTCQCWDLMQVTERKWQGSKIKVVTQANAQRKLGFRPEDFNQSIAADAYLLGRRDLLNYIKQLERKGNEATEPFWVEHYSRLAIPFSALIFTLMGLSLSARKKRGGIGSTLGIGLGLCFAFIVMQRFSLTFAIKGNFPPLLAAWTPNILFGLGTAWLYQRAPQSFR